MNVDMAKRLADRRRASGLSQEGLAERLGVTRQAVSKWERSESSPDTDNLIALAQLYGVSLDDLLYADVAAEDAEEPVAEAGVAPAAEEEPIVVEAVAVEDEAGGTAAPDASEPSAAAGAGKKAGDFHIGFDGIRVDDGKDYVNVSWRDGVHVIDGRGGDEVHVGWDGVHINDKSYSSMREAHEDFRNGHRGHGPWDESAASGLSPQRRKLWRTLNTFPFPLLVIIAYILLGCFCGTWLIGLELFLLIPIYYATVGLFVGRRAHAFFSVLYPVVVVGWFFYMAFVLNEPHPAWAAFLTIPLAEWLFAALAHWWRRRKPQ